MRNPVLAVLLALVLQGAGLVHAAPAPAAGPAEPQTAFPQDFDALLREAWRALRMGDQERAMLAYEKVLARADDSRMQVRALVCIAMARLAPSSPAHDAEAGELAVQELERRIKLYGLEQEFFGEVELLRLVASQQKELATLRGSKRALQKELATRDALIRQLRALSVDQP